MGFLSDLYHSHQQLKEKIHKTRIPLGKQGQIFMGFVYFCIPLIGGKFVYDWTISKNHEKWKLDENGNVIVPRKVAERKDELARNKVQAQVILSAVKKEVDENFGTSAPLQK